MEYTDKKSIKDFNFEEARGWLIDRMNHIELNLDYLIIDKLEIPKSKRYFVVESVLNSSIIPFGSKIKILIQLFPDKSFSDFFKKLRRMGSIRNAFAHSTIIQNINVCLEASTSSTSVSLDHTVALVESNGAIKHEKCLDLLNEFLKLKNEVQEKLDSMNCKK